MHLTVLTLALAIGLLGAAGHAEVPPPFPEFSAKRIGVPQAGQRRIDVQIDPEAQSAVLSRPLTQGGPVPSGALGQHAWFWERISPSMEGVPPGRLASALEVLAGSDKIASPPLAQMQRIAERNGKDILRSTVGTRVSPALVLAVITVETAGKTDAVSAAGAQGLMQLMPQTAARFGVQDSLVAADNIAGGVAYLDGLMEAFASDPMLVLAAYNAGEGAVRSHEGVPPFAETRDYVPKVLAAFRVARGLCRTPPELISDGCVFAVLR